MQQEVLFTDEIKAILSPVKNQYDHEKVWVAALAVTKQPETGSKKLFSDTCASSITKDQIHKLQHEDLVISSAIKLKKQKLKSTNKDQSA